jgi:hypothetical protein
MRSRLRLKPLLRVQKPRSQHVCGSIKVDNEVIVLTSPVTADAQPPATKENVPPSTTAATTEATTSSEQATSNETAAPTQTDQLAQQPTNASTEEKVAVTMEEPPPIKDVKAAPGMSATSGPLEEFPEGGYATNGDKQ